MLDDNKVKAAIRAKIVYLTKCIMQMENCNEEIAYKRLISTHIYKLLIDKKTGLYLEPAEFVIKAYDIERHNSKEDMIAYINKA